MKKEYEIKVKKQGNIEPKSILLDIMAKVMMLDAETDEKYHDELETVMAQFQKILDDYHVN